MVVAQFILYILTFFILLRFFQWTIQSIGSRSSLPGPRFWEFFQNSREFFRAPHKMMSRWADIFGDIYEVGVLGKRLVILNTIDLAKEAFSNPDIYMEMPTHSGFSTYAGGEFGTGCSASNSWPEVRKFTVKAIADFNNPSVAKSDDQQPSLMMQGVEEAIEAIAATKSRAVTSRNFFTIPIFNVMWLATTNMRWPQEKADVIRRFHETFGAFQSSFWPTFLGTSLDRIYTVFGWQPKIIREYQESIHTVWKILDDIIDEHEVKTGEGNETGKISTKLNFTAAFFQRRGQLEEKQIRKSAFFGQDGKKRLRASLIDLNFAGNGTVSLTLEWTLAYLTAHPEAQTRIRQDLNALLGPIGKGRNVTLADRKSLPFLEATLLEILRMSTPAPIVMHLASRDTKIAGHFVPKGSYVVANLFRMTFDPKNWTNPSTFIPQRFLAEGTKKDEHGPSSSPIVDRQKADSIMTFSLGKRQCPGKPFAMDTLFLLLARILHRFNVKNGDSQNGGVGVGVSEGVFEFFLQPQDSTLIFEDLLK